MAPKERRRVKLKASSVKAASVSPLFIPGEPQPPEE